MKTTFQVTLAFDVSCYRTVEVQAKNAKEAMKKARLEALDMSFDINWDTASDYRVVDIES